ncbi:Ornithine carbamoyltransferase, partial [hydrothermal vent metagenome]
PDEYAPSQGMLADIAAAGDKINLIEAPKEAAKNSDLIIADTWVSMGDKDASERRRILSPYRVDKNLMNMANSDALFMHCLPAHRGDEVSAEVMDGPQSVVFDEAENRLHIQKAILAYVFGIEELS